jgi:hypothetical protein
MNQSDDTPEYFGLKFTEQELLMLGQTADALSAYMGAVVLAELGRNEDTEWVIFGRAIGQDEEPDESIFHVQLGGPDTRLLGQKGGLDTAVDSYDCEFLWAVEITEDEDERYVRLDQEGEIFDAASDLATLLPFSLAEPELPSLDEADEDEGEEDEDENPDDDPNVGDDLGDAATDAPKPPTLH